MIEENDDELEAYLDTDSPKQDTTETDTSTQNPVPEERKKVEVDISWSQPTDKSWSKKRVTINLPSDVMDKTMEALRSAPNVNIVDNEKGKDWFNVLDNGTSFLSFKDQFFKNTQDQDTDYSNKIEFNGSEFSPTIIAGNGGTNRNLTGEISNIYMLSALGLGGVFQVPLWHSGFYMSFKPPHEAALIELNRIISNDVIDYGRYSYAMAFNNSSVYTNERLMTFCLEHMHSSTVRVAKPSIEVFADLIKPQDLPAMLLGVAGAWFNKGFQYRRACINNPNKCQHVAEGFVNLTKMMWVDKNALPASALPHMISRKPNSMTEESVIKYQEAIQKHLPYTFEVSPIQGSQIAFKLKTPNMTSYINAGHSWVDGIARAVEKAITDTDDVDKRNTIIDQHSRSTNMRQYSHWVEEIKIVDNNNVITELSSIESNLGILSQEPEVSEQFIKGVEEYIEKSAIALVGVPNFKCPVCGTEQADDNTKSLGVILPMDVTSLFFDIVTQKLTDINRRKLV